MSKSSSGFSLSWIIIAIIGYNLFFDSDDEKTVEVVEDNTPAVEQPAEESGGISIDIDTDRLKEDAKILLEDAKNALGEAREDLNEHLAERRKERKQTPVVEEPEQQSVPPEVKDKTPKNDSPEPETEMQKL